MVILCGVLTATCPPPLKWSHILFNSVLFRPSHYSPVGMPSNNRVYATMEYSPGEIASSPSQEVLNRGWLVGLSDAVLTQRLS